MRENLIVYKTAAVTIEVTAAAVSAHWDRMSVPYNVVGYADWMNEYPYKLKARFRIAHTGTSCKTKSYGQYQ